MALVILALLPIQIWALSMSVFAVSESVSAALLTAIIAGSFSLLNTLLNALILKHTRSVQAKADRALELVGERQSDKRSSSVGRKDISESLTKDRRKG